MLRASDLPHGAVAVAEHQTAGRGRSGRRWDDAPSTALLFSVLLRPPATTPLAQLSLVAGLAVAAAIERETGLPAHREVAERRPRRRRARWQGILLEAAEARVVCGIGINVNQEERDLPRLPRLPATSLRIGAGRPFDRAVILAAVLGELERRYAHWLDGGSERLRGRARAPERRSRPTRPGGRPGGHGRGDRP